MSIVSEWKMAKSLLPRAIAPCAPIARRPVVYDVTAPGHASRHVMINIESAREKTAVVENSIQHVVDHVKTFPKSV